MINKTDTWWDYCRDDPPHIVFCFVLFIAFGIILHYLTPPVFVCISVLPHPPIPSLPLSLSFLCNKLNVLHKETIERISEKLLFLFRHYWLQVSYQTSSDDRINRSITSVACIRDHNHSLHISLSVIKTFPSANITALCKYTQYFLSLSLHHLSLKTHKNESKHTPTRTLFFFFF